MVVGNERGMVRNWELVAIVDCYNEVDKQINDDDR